MPYIEIDEVDPSAIVIQTNFADRHLMRELPGASYRQGRWQAPLAWSTCLTLRGLFSGELTLGPDITRWAHDLRALRVDRLLEIRELLHPDTGDAEFDQNLNQVEEASSHKPLHLYSYQRVDVEFLYRAQYALLANEPGLGKTAVIIRTLQMLAHGGQTPFPALIVCPNSLKITVWEREFDTWAPGIHVVVVDGTADKRRRLIKQAQELDKGGDAVVVVINWEALRLHSRLAPYGSIALSDRDRAPKELNELGHQTIVFDEAHRLKDPHSQQARAAWAIAHQARFRYALTGTPVASHLGDLWPILHALDPGGFPAKTKFMDRYARTTLNFFGGAEVIGINPLTEEELHRITNPMIRRVPKEAALPQLPPKLPTQYRYTTMTASQARAYRQLEETMLAELEGGVMVAASPLVQLTRLLQFASSSATINDAGEVKLALPSSKVDDLVDYLEELGEEPLVVTAESKQLINLAARRLSDIRISFGLVTGDQSPVERQRAVKRFQEGSDRVILMTLGAGAEGLTLTRASRILFMQRSWSMIRNKQAEDRIHRIGAEGHQVIQVIEQITPDTVEERRLSVLAEKDERAEEVLRDRIVLARLLGARE